MLVSFAPILVKAVSLTGLGPTAIAMWRCLIGAALLLAAARRAGPLALPARALRLLAFAGLAFALDLGVWHRSILLVGAGMATILGNTQVFVTAALSRAFFCERLTVRFLLAAAAALGGVALLVGVGSRVEFNADYLTGVGFGLATGLIYGTFLTLLRAAGRSAEPASILTLPAWFSTWAALFLVAGSAAEGGLELPPSRIAWLWLALLAVVAQALGWSVITRSIARVPGSLAGLVLLLQPVLATAWGAWWFGERLQPLQIAGAVITLLAISAGTQRRTVRPAGAAGAS